LVQFPVRQRVRIKHASFGPSGNDPQKAVKLRENRAQTREIHAPLAAGTADSLGNCDGISDA
jgi:hypothetical protein